MLIKSISLKNFRQFVDETIEFSTDPSQNVTLIMGDNGSGKTTFLQAFFWCLYGTTDFADQSVINHDVAQKLLPDRQEEVRVVLTLQHGSADYEITRTQNYTKTRANKINRDNTVLNICKKLEDGNTTYLKKTECENEIQTILPVELSRYFFFDGERIEKMSKEVATGKKSKGFAEAIMGLTGLKAIQAALFHMKPSKANSVMGRFNDDYSGDSANAIAAINKEIEAIEKKEETINNRLQEIEDEVEEANAFIKEFEAELKGYAEAADLQKNRESLCKSRDREKELRTKKVKEVTNTLNREMESFFSAKMVSQALESISTSEFSGKDIPELHSKSVKFLLNRGTCICGTDLSEGTIPYKKLTELIDYLPPQAIGVTVGQFVKDCKRLYQEDCSLYEQYADLLNDVRDFDDAIENIDNDILQIDKQLSGKDVSAEVSTLKRKISDLEATIEADTTEQGNLKYDSGALSKEREGKEFDRSKLSSADKKNEQIETYKMYAQAIYDRLNEKYTLQEQQIRNTLERTMNDLFKKIYDGGLSVSIDEKYHVRVFADNSDFDVETSTAQGISVIFAFISAIIKMARDNQQEEQNLSYSEPYPLVMDAPLSAFDKTRIQAICDAIPQTAEQVIMFIKDTDGELAEEYLGSKVYKRHCFEKVDEFNSHLI